MSSQTPPVNSLTKKGASSLETSMSDSDDSEDDLSFSKGATPIHAPLQETTTEGSMGTTLGLQSTWSDPRAQHPVAGMEWISSADSKCFLYITNLTLVIYGT